MTGNTSPNEIDGCDLRIVAELEQVRRQRAFLGELPAFRRGLMYFDFDAGKVSVAPIGGAA